MSEVLYMFKIDLARSEDALQKVGAMAKLHCVAKRL